MNNSMGFLLTLFGAFIIANYRILIRKLLNRGNTQKERPAESVLNAGSFSVATSIVFLLFLATSGDANIKPAFWKAVLISGILNIGISLCSFQALKKEAASLVVPIFDTTPAIIVFIAMFLTGEKPTTLGYVGILFLVFGTYTLNIRELIEKLQNKKSALRAYFAPFLELGRSVGVRYAMVASVMGCISLSYDAIAARNANPFFAVACILSFSAIAHTVRAILMGHGKQFCDKKRLMPHGALIGALYALAVSAYMWSFRYMLISYQATIKRVETFIVLVLAYIILGEKKDFRSRLIAVILMMIGVTLISLQ